MKSNFVQYSTPQMRVLSKEQIEEIHYATLEILQRTGVKIPNEESKELLHGAGAFIGNNDRVFFSPNIIEDALKKPPSRISFVNRDGEPAMALEGNKVYFGANVDSPDFFDPETRERRPFVSTDSIYTAQVVDYLPHLDFVLTVGWGTDIPAEIADRVTVRNLILNYRKVLGVSCSSAESLKDVIDMASIVAGSLDQLKLNPYMFAILEPISPLAHDIHGLDQLLVCAENNIPVVYYPMPMSGATAPATAAGTLAQNNAEVLSGLAIHQLKKPGAPFIYGGIPAAMDMKTTRFTYGCPELWLQNAGLAEIAHHYNLPVWGTACTDSKYVDQQAAVEISMAALMSALSGANLVHDVGLMDQATAVSLEMYILADEAISIVKKIMGGIDVNDETLALDVIDNVGKTPSGTFLNEDHTFKHFKSFWVPELFDRTWYDKNKPVKSIDDKLNEKARHIIKNHDASLEDVKKKQILEIEKKWMRG